jgi:hypothetical integral membrane protein (TIGR02206 family)
VEPFIPFSLSHWIVLALMIGLAYTGARIKARWMRIFLSVGLIGGVVLNLVVRDYTSGIRLEDLLPLHLCDLSIFFALLALWTGSQRLSELVYFWACSGTLLAVVLPAVTYDFPDSHFITYFVLHGMVITAAMHLTFALDLKPQKHAPLRILGITALYAGLVGLIDLALGENFLFLCRKPEQATLLDYLGPWPVYIFVAGLVGLAMWSLLALPFTRRRGVP